VVTISMPEHRQSEPAAATARGGRSRDRLSRDEEYELAGRVAEGDRGARNRLVQANLGLVVSIARRYMGKGLDLEDLVGEGNLGLVRAAEAFDPRFGTRFGTYAVCWIHQAIRHALMNTASTIRVPERMVGLLMKWRRAEWALGRELGRPPEFDEVATHLGLNDVKRSLVARALGAGRLRTGGRDDEAGVGLYLTVADSQWSAEEGFEAQEERAVARRLVARLKDRERTVVTLRFGLEGEALTLEEIGQRLGVTRERVRQIENHALGKLGAACGRPADDARTSAAHPRAACAIGGPIAS
jgi:RNA polymerase primary sigma factor